MTEEPTPLQHAHATLWRLTHARLCPFTSRVGVLAMSKRAGATLSSIAPIGDDERPSRLVGWRQGFGPICDPRHPGFLAWSYPVVRAAGTTAERVQHKIGHTDHVCPTFAVRNVSLGYAINVDMVLVAHHPDWPSRTLHCRMRVTDHPTDIKRRSIIVAPFNPATETFFSTLPGSEPDPHLGHEHGVTLPPFSLPHPFHPNYMDLFMDPDMVSGDKATHWSVGTMRQSGEGRKWWHFEVRPDGSPRRVRRLPRPLRGRLPQPRTSSTQ